MIKIQIERFSLLFGLSHFWWLRQIVYPTLKWPDLFCSKNRYLFRVGEHSLSTLRLNRNKRPDLAYLTSHQMANYCFLLIRLMTISLHLLSLLLITWTTFKFRATYLNLFIILKPNTVITNLTLFMPVIYVSSISQSSTFDF